MAVILAAIAIVIIFVIIETPILMVLHALGWITINFL